MNETPQIPVTLLRDKFGQYLINVSGGTRIIVTRHDMPVAALVSVEDFKVLEALGEKIHNTSICEPKGYGA